MSQHTILTQNYFKFANKFYKQGKILAMGALSSEMLAEIYLQSLDHNDISIYNIPRKQKIMGYFRYVNDFLIGYNGKLVSINNMLQGVNSIYI
jgi:hypothetical protein